MTKEQISNILKLRVRECNMKVEEFSKGARENIMAEMIWTAKVETYESVIKLLES